MDAGERLSVWLTDTAAGRYTAAAEQRFFDRALQGCSGRVVQLGLPELPWGASVAPICLGRDVQMSADTQAWADGVLDGLLMPHVLETSAHPWQVLAEAHRVLRPGGRIVLSGLNPHSLWRWSGWFDGRRLPRRACCIPLPRLKQQVKSLGFTIEGGCFMVYVPAVGSTAALMRWRFMESAGDRWWPHMAAVYGLVLIKQVHALRVLPEYEQHLQAEGEMLLGAVGSVKGRLMME